MEKCMPSIEQNGGQSRQAAGPQPEPGRARSILEIGDLRVWFPIRKGVLALAHGWVRAVDGVSLTVHEGETLGLVGESGCGKSTLARAVAQLERPRSGSIRFRGAELSAAGARELREHRRELQMVFQDPFSSLNPRMTVLEMVTEGLIEHGIVRRRDRLDAAVKLLDEVGMGRDAAYRFPHEFSGGQRQRISLARALSMRPSLVVCDEPVSALDVSVQAQVINLLLDLKQRHNLSYLFISHDLGVVRHVADRVAVMYLGRIVEQGSVEDVIDRPVHPYTGALVSAVPKVGGTGRDRVVLQGDVPSPSNPPAGCRFHTRCPFATGRCAAGEPELEPFTVPGDASERRVACIRKTEIGAQRPTVRP
jgi:oligopeptide/dipeptide ABC transporter ATP-binding protein